MTELQPAQSRPASRKGRPTADASQRKMAEVLRVARIQFCRHGYRNTTMEAIAAVADVSKRTLYKWHSDKTALFQACTIEGAERFPLPSPDEKRDPKIVLENFAADLLRDLTAEDSYRLGLLLFREGYEFPDIAQVVDEQQRHFLSEPVAAYLQAQGMEEPGSYERAEILISMILSDFHRRMMYNRVMPTEEEIIRHAQQVTAIFLNGSRLNQ